MEFKEAFVKKCHISQNAEIQKVPDSIDQSIIFLRTLPCEFDESYMAMTHFDKMIKTDKSTSQIIYWEEMELRVAYLWKTMGFRGLALLESFVSSTNSENYYAAIIILRSLLENSALLHFYFIKIKPFYEDWSKNDVMGRILRKETDKFFVFGELEDLLIKYSHGTTLRELTKQKPEWAIESIGKTIKSISTEAGFEKIYDSYSLLCQVAHPSIGSNMIFGKGVDMSNKYHTYVFSRNQNIAFFLGTIAYPLNLSCKIMTEDIREMANIRFTV